ncbi:hypothetical protein HMPREF9499_00283 [Enterococcus faecalis TX0012]|nr:hypothetical protein HMPREF9499_00283 [Enterococcus faecalis TX0012]
MDFRMGYFQFVKDNFLLCEKKTARTQIKIVNNRKKGIISYILLKYAQLECPATYLITI